MEGLQESNHKLQVDLAEAREEVCKRDQMIKSLQAEVKKLTKRMQTETTDLKRQRTELEKDLDKAKNEIEILQAQAEGMRKNHNNLINLMKRLKFYYSFIYEGEIFHQTSLCFFISL